MSPEAHRRGSRRSQCGGKRRYHDFDQAKEFRRRCEYHQRNQLRIYECPFCKGFHLTSQVARSDAAAN